MKRQAVVWLLGFFACLLVIFPAWAAEGPGEYIHDPEQFCFSTKERQELNARAQEIENQYGIQVHAYIQTAEAAQIHELAQQLYQQAAGEMEGMLLLDAGGQIELYYTDGLSQEISPAEAHDMIGAYVFADTYYLGTQAYLEKAQEQLEQMGAQEGSGSTRAALEPEGSRRVVDEAGLLTQEEREALGDRLDQIYETQPWEVAVLTVDSLEGESPDYFIQGYYDYNGYGKGSSRDGVMLMVAMDSRDWQITACGLAKEVLPKERQDEISQDFLPYLSSGDYAQAFQIFADQCSLAMERFEKTPEGAEILGEPLTLGQRAVYGLSQAAGSGGLLIAAAVGAITAAAGILYLRSQLKSVRPVNNAADYMKPGSLNITERRDLFLYRNVTRTPRPKNNGPKGGGGSGGSHSSGRHEGTGGKF